MKRKPPKKYIKNKVIWIRRFLGRIREIKEGCYCIDLWPQWKTSLVKEFHEVLSKKTKNFYRRSNCKFYAGRPIEMWSWCENVDGVETVKLYMRGLT